METTTTGILFQTDGEVYRQTIQYTKLPDTSIQDMVKQQALEMPIVMPLLQSVKLAAKGGERWLMQTIDSLVFNGPVVFSANEDGEPCLLPYWVPGSTASTFKLKNPLTWNTPSTMDLFFINKIGAGPGSLYLIAADNRTGSIYRIPTTNLYDDGKLCPGRLDPIDTMNPVKMFQEYYRSWEANEWNTDLPPNRERAQRMFKWDDEGVQQPVREDWEADCDPISVSFNWIFKELYKEVINND